MKKLFTLGMLIGFITMSYGQKLAIYNVTATAEDYVLLLETKGYMAFAFDVTSLNVLQGVQRDAKEKSPHPLAISRKISIFVEIFMN